jgi:UDP-N-acetylglucosamine:LPS N-acetylglucosamine transferase
MKIMLVCSSGGHFHYARTTAFWYTHERVWVTFLTATTKAALEEERVYWAWSPTNRNLRNLLRNFFLAWKVLYQECPHLVISTGAGVTVPFLILAKF